MTIKVNTPNKELIGIENIEKALIRLFDVDKYRLVFWYDEKNELSEEFAALNLKHVKKIKLGNNEFAIKHRLIKEEPEQKFLIYRAGPALELENNWLFDLVLANVEFKADRASIQLTELGLDFKFTELVENHIKFFDSKDRVSILKQQLEAIEPGKIHTELIKQKMLAIAVGITDSRVESILEKLLEELANKKDDRLKQINRANLEDYLFTKVKTIYGYDSNINTIKDFSLKLFKSAYLRTIDSTNANIPLNEEAIVLLRRWKDNRHYTDSFEILSEESSRDLDIESKLNSIDFKSLLDIDYFELIEKKIISELRDLIVDRRISEDEALKIISRRKTSHWYKKYQHIYDALSTSVSFVYAIKNNDFRIDTPSQALKKYTENWYRIDQLYRQFTYNAQASSQTSLLNELSDTIDKLYSNNYLLVLNDNWQQHIDKLDKWEIPDLTMQRGFYTQWVEPFVSKDRKIVVIISDAMRYEIGEELRTRIVQEDRYIAEIEPAISMLPSYTQLGMAALLPNNELEIVDDDSSTVLVDSMPSAGRANRQKILEANCPKPAIAFLAKEILALTRDEAREVTKANDVIYIYHNLIDHTGDKLTSEDRAFIACEDSLEEIITLVKKMNNANANNFIVTADHGFIYQNQSLNESDFLSPGIDFENVSFKNRRFILGKSLKEHPSLKKFSSAQLGLTGNVEVQIPKSINRLRVKGSGSRFVHGGASLQEIVIPVILINKKRQSDVSQVEVEIIRGTNSIISSGQLSVTFYQSSAVEEKIHPIKLRAGLYTRAGELISDEHNLVFDFESSNPRDRERSISLILSKAANKANGQEVVLKLQEKIKDSDEYSEYKSITYTLRRSFTSDFDL